MQAESWQAENANIWRFDANGRDDMENKNELHDEDVTEWDRKLAVPMFIVALLYLMIAGSLLHLTNGTPGSTRSLLLLSILGVLHLFVIAEAILQWRVGGSNARRHILYVIIPVFRLCPRDHVNGDHAWLPVIGWRRTSMGLERHMTKVFSWPMIMIALMILPVIGVEFLYSDWIAEYPRRKFFIDTCSGFIWMAFVFEFVVMFSIVEKRLPYCKRNWIDIAVIVLPIVSFAGAAPLGRLIKLNQLTRTAKIYRMRGVLLRSFRALVALDVLSKILRRDAEQRFNRLEIQIAEKQQEIEFLTSELEREREKMEAKLKKQNEAAE